MNSLKLFVLLILTSDLDDPIDRSIYISFLLTVKMNHDRLDILDILDIYKNISYIISILGNRIDK